MTESDDLPTLVADLHAHLQATAELPVETTASRWLGEAEAVCADVVGEDAPKAAIETRVEQVAMLLSNVEATGSDAADEHVAAARELVEEIERRL